MDPHFFERVGEGAQGAMRNEHTHSRRKNSERQTVCAYPAMKQVVFKVVLAGIGLVLL